MAPETATAIASFSLEIMAIHAIYPEICKKSDIHIKGELIADETKGQTCLRLLGNAMPLNACLSRLWLSTVLSVTVATNIHELKPFTATTFLDASK